MLVIGFAGKGGVGKSEMTVGLLMKYPAVLRSFADHLKEVTKLLFGLTDWHVNTPDGKKSIIPGIDITVRKALQIVGTDFGRNMIHKDLWVIQEEKQINEYKEESTIIYDDLRFPNECDMIHRKKGLIIYLYREFKSDFTKEEQNHTSEKSMDLNKVDIFLNIPNNIRLANEIVHEAVVKFIGERNGERV